MLEISRKDVQEGGLVSYYSEDRFIKLPVMTYMDLLGVTPIPSQIAIINAINNPKYRFICGAVSRRQGKTYISNIIGQLTALVPNTNILLMSKFDLKLVSINMYVKI